MTDDTCAKCGAPALHGRHLRDEKCEPRATDEDLNALYAAMAAVKPPLVAKDLIRHLDPVPKGNGTVVRVKFLSELPGWRVRELIKDCERYAAKHGKGGAS